MTFEIEGGPVLVINTLPRTPTRLFLLDLQKNSRASQSWYVNSHFSRCRAPLYRSPLSLARSLALLNRFFNPDPSPPTSCL